MTAISIGLAPAPWTSRTWPWNGFVGPFTVTRRAQTDARGGMQPQSPILHHHVEQRQVAREHLLAELEMQTSDNG